MAINERDFEGIQLGAIRHTPEDWVIFKGDSKTLSLSLEDYNKGGWGSMINGFKVHNSVLRRFTKVEDVETGEFGLDDDGKKIPDYELNEDGTEKKDEAGNKIQKKDEAGNLLFKKVILTDQNVLYLGKAFYEMAFRLVSAIVSSYEILRNTDFADLEQDTKEWLIIACFKAIEFSSMNNQYWERVNGSGISNPNFSISIDQTNWLLTLDMAGQEAVNALVNSGIQDYEWVTDKELSRKTSKGNTRILTTKDVLVNLLKGDE